MSDAELDSDSPPVSTRHDFSTRTGPTTWDSDLGGFDFAGPLLEFDQVREQIAAYTKTVVGGERARALTPTRDLLEIATRQQETSEAKQYLDQGGGLEFGPEEDFRELLQRALLGGLLRGGELFLVRELLRAARYDRTELGRHEEIPLLSSIADNIPELGDLERAISGAISPAGEVLEMPDTGGLADYVSTQEMLDHLQDAVARADSDHMKKRTALESQIRAEQEFFARHASLKTEMNEALKERVKAALEEAFGLNVTDLDDVYEDKNADLWIDDHGIVIEVRGSKRRNATEDDVDDVVDHSDTLVGLGRRVRGKVLLFNGQLGKLPQDRSDDVFSSGVIREAQKADVSLMTGDDLLRLVELARLGQYETETLIETLRTPGRFQGIPEPRHEL
ncbi:MAG: hypothetical protein IIB26_09120 [Chloroflexi bacterium]|nr:hypothetical protein [Chloroflexota bacterium]